MADNIKTKRTGRIKFQQFRHSATEYMYMPRNMPTDLACVFLLLFAGKRNYRYL